MSQYFDVSVSAADVGRHVCEDTELLSEIFNDVGWRIHHDEETLDAEAFERFVDALDDDGRRIFSQLAAAVAATEGV